MGLHDFYVGLLTFFMERGRRGRVGALCPRIDQEGRGAVPRHSGVREIHGEN